MSYRLSVLSGLCIYAAMWAPPVALANPSASEAAKGLVRIHVFGQAQNGTEGGESVDNWGSGVVLSKDRVVTAYHVIHQNLYGDEILWMTGSPKIEVESFNSKGAPQRASSNVRVENGGNSASDVVELDVPGLSTSAPCSLKALDANAQLYGLGLQRDHNSYELFGPGYLAPYDSANDGEHRKIFSMNADPGDSGGPVFGDSGLIVGILTNGRDLRITPGAAYSLFTPFWTLAQGPSSLQNSLHDCQKAACPKIENLGKLGYVEGHKTHFCQDHGFEGVTNFPNTGYMDNNGGWCYSGNAEACLDSLRMQR